LKVRRLKILLVGAQGGWGCSSRVGRRIPQFLFSPEPYSYLLVTVASPILIGGNGRRLLTLAAREADIIGFSGITFRDGGATPSDLSGWKVSGVDERVNLVREAAGAERYERLELNALVQRVVVTDNRHKMAEELTGRWTQLTPDDILQTPYVLIGTIDQMVEDLQACRERWGISYYVVREPDLDDFKERSLYEGDLSSPAASTMAASE
jgi:alkanesulfonate monooxygenase SsuD/methylene tetrahydromethanopterin reductase-like flavin-dependent oxidoreductase (luciferase family)